MREIGATIRAFEDQPSQERIASIGNLLQNLMDLNVQRINILVASDVDKSNSYGRLKNTIRSRGLENERIILSKFAGNPFTDLLNRGRELNSEHGLDSLIISPEIGEFINHTHLDAMQEALKKPAIAVSCLAISETTSSDAYNSENLDSDDCGSEGLKQTIMKGRLANTCCLWKDSVLDIIKGFGEEGNDGVEEIQVLLDMISLGYETAPIETDIEYSSFPKTDEYQIAKFPTKPTRQINAYLRYLLKRGMIDSDRFDRVFCKKQTDGSYKKATDSTLRGKYQSELIQLLQNAIHEDYSGVE